MLSRRRRIRAASGFLLFLVALMPLTLVGVALSADYTRALLAKRQATNAADVIAMAAATAIDDSTVDEVGACVSAPCPAALSARVRIDDAIAEERARELFSLAESTGMLPANLEARLGDVSVCPRGDLTCRGGQEVSVTITYKVPSFFVIRIITADDGETVSGEVVRSAEICDPADLARGAGAGCAYPLGG
jgi:hypothetical protein